MKVVFSLILISALSFNAMYAQSSKQSKYPPAHVTNWGQSSYVVTDDFWASVKEDVVKQIGSYSFEKAKVYSKNENKPPRMLLFDGDKKLTLSEYYKRLSGLKVYKVATFNQIWNNKDWGKYVLLAAPYKENVNWDTASKWDTVYFIVKAEGVQ